ncbi:MAG: ribonuclease D [archaeon]
MTDVEFTFIDTPEKLRKAADEWKQSKVLGIDIECENNLHHFGAYVAIFQISTREKNWILDALQLEDLSPFLEVLTDPDIIKIFHDVSFDLRIIRRQYGTQVRGLCDTQLMAQFLAMTDLSLGSLLETYFGVKKIKKFQMADWTKRPLKEEMLSYAVLDSKYLIPLRDKLEAMLSEKGYLQWVEEEFIALEDKGFIYGEGTFSDLRGYGMLTDRQRGVLKQLYFLREQFAQRLDRPVHFVISTKLLMDIACNPPRNVDGWKQMKGVHPLVRAQAQRFFNEVGIGMRKPIPFNPERAKRYSPQQKAFINRLSLVRDQISEKTGVTKHLILNKDQMHQAALTGKLDSLRGWQMKLFDGKV